MASTQSPATTPTGRPRRTRDQIAEGKRAREKEKMDRRAAKLLARQNRARGLIDDSPKKDVTEKPARQFVPVELENLAEPQYTRVSHALPRHVVLEVLNTRPFAGGLFVPTTNTGGTAAEFVLPDPLLDPLDLFEVECLVPSIPSHVAAEFGDWGAYEEENTEDDLIAAFDRRNITEQIEELSPYERNLILDAVLSRFDADPGAITDEEQIVLDCLDHAEEPKSYPARLMMFL